MSEPREYKIKTSAERLHWISHTLGKMLKEMEKQTYIMQQGPAPRVVGYSEKEPF